MNRFNHKLLLLIYKNCSIRLKRSTSAEHEYIFKKDDEIYLEILISDDGKEWRYVNTNQPSLSRIFTTTVPITSLEDFENDLKRMCIEIPEKIEALKK